MQQQIDAFIREFESDSPVLEVQTSGSTGTPKRMFVEKQRMMRSAQRTLSALGIQQHAVALICLPVQYIAGKMMVVRALVGHMRIEAIRPCANPLLELDENRIAPQTLLAITPHQLSEILSNATSRRILEKLSHVIIGGGAIPECVENMARKVPEKVQIYATYGMTETLSHIALRRINGADCQESFQPLESVSVSQNSEGCLVLNDAATTSEPLVTNDLIALLPDGRFRIIGRRDNVISSGGIKLQIEQIEQQLRTALPCEFLLTYIADNQLGQALTMLYKGAQTEEELRKICAERLERYEVPKHFFRVPEIPTTETGKPARKQAHLIAESLKMM